MTPWEKFQHHKDQIEFQRHLGFYDIGHKYAYMQAIQAIYNKLYDEQDHCNHPQEYKRNPGEYHAFCRYCGSHLFECYSL